MQSISTKQPFIHDEDFDDGVYYPQDDGKPMSDNTLQFEWITLIKLGLDLAFANREDIFVAGDLLWYPVKGDNKIRQAPDVMVVVGRPKGYRGSYKQFREEGIAPQVVFEIVSPGNRIAEMVRKFEFYEQYGVLEYYVYDPHKHTLEAYYRDEPEDYWPDLVTHDLKRWRSPVLGLEMSWINHEFTLYQADGTPFLTYSELAEKARQSQKALEDIELKAQKLAEKLRSLGIDPESI